MVLMCYLCMYAYYYVKRGKYEYENMHVCIEYAQDVSQKWSNMIKYDNNEMRDYPKMGAQI